MAKKSKARKTQPDASSQKEGVGLTQPAPSPSLPTDGELEAEWNHRLTEPEEKRNSRASAMLETPAPDLDDRMMRYRQIGRCPECGARPVVCLMLRPPYAKFRCRVCEHVWEKTDF